MGQRKMKGRVVVGEEEDGGTVGDEGGRNRGMGEKCWWGRWGTKKW